MNKKNKQINIRVEAAMFEAIMVKAGLEYRQISEIVRGLLLAWLRKKA